MLITSPNLTQPDDVYASLIAMHDGLNESQSAALNARLILILVNHIGDTGVITEAIEAARKSG